MATVKLGAFGLDIGTGKFTVASASGNTVVAGTLNVTSNLTVASGQGVFMTALVGNFSPNLDLYFQPGGTSGRVVFRSSGSSELVVISNAGKVTTVASASGGAGLNLPHGAAPSSPVNGDVWSTTSGLFVRINGATVGPLS